jgi:type II secretory pathway pseudopilin PulG
MGRRARRSRSSGFTLLEVVIAMLPLMVALTLFSGTLAAGSKQRVSNRERMRAAWAIQEVLEQMRNADFRALHALYNADPFDDPGGPGTAPGTNFAVPGFTPVVGDADGMVGEVLLPLANVGTEVAPVWIVSEDLESEDLLMPRDLNGDILVDDLDHSADYTILPIVVRVRWTSLGRPRELSIQTALTEYHE